MIDLAKHAVARHTRSSASPRFPASARPAPSFLNAQQDFSRLLNDRHRAILQRIATRLRLPPRTTLYQRDSPARWVFMVADGSLKSFREMPSGRRKIAAFLFADDIFGLAEDGRYVNTVQSLTTTALYRIPLDALHTEMMHDGEMAIRFLCKVTHELREAQHAAITLCRREAVGRLAMFLEMIARRMPDVGDGTSLNLPMSRADIADFVGLSAEAISRASAELERRGLVRFGGRRVVQVLDAAGLKKLALAS